MQRCSHRQWTVPRHRAVRCSSRISSRVSPPLGPLVRLPFRANGERLFVVSDEKLTAEEMRAEIFELLDEAVASSLLNLVTAMRLADSGDLDLHDVFDPDERELLMKGWGGLRDDRRQRIIERACWCVERQVLLDIDERIMRRRIEVAVARALEQAGAGKVG